MVGVAVGVGVAVAVVVGVVVGVVVVVGVGVAVVVGVGVVVGMILKSIAIENFLRLKAFNLTLETPVVVVAGHNETGKTSIQEAVRLALTGRFARVELKKELGELVHDGADKAVISVESDTMSAAVTIKKGGAATGIPNPDNIPPALLATLDMHYLTSLPDKERRDLLFKLAGVDVTLTAVGKMMGEQGASEADIKELSPFLRNGFDAAMQEARSRAKDGRAAWKQITGENYGSEKAETWQSPQPDASMQDAAAMEKEFAALLNREGEIRATLNQAEQQKQRAETLVKKQGELQAFVDRAPDLRDALKAKDKAIEVGRSNLDALINEYEALPKKNAQHNVAPMNCPSCDAELAVVNGALVDYDRPVEVDEARLTTLRAKIDSLNDGIDTLNADVGILKDRIRQAEQAEAQLKGMVMASTSNQFANTIGLEAEAAENRARQAELRPQIGAAKASAFAAESAGRLTVEAKARHQDVLRWENLESMLSPNGIPALLLAKSIKPMNELLLESSVLSGWEQVHIDAEMNIFYGSHRYALLSESAKWRTDAMLCAAIAGLNGIKALLLDRFDVLDSPGRSELLNWAEGLYEKYGIQSLLFGTLKERVTLEGIQDVWLTKEAP